MDIIDPSIDRYLDDLADCDDPILREMEQIADERSFPIVGRQVGRLLELLAGIMGARRVIELGSGYGYSAYWLARGVGPEGRVMLTERSAERAEQARVFLERGGLLDRVEIVVGDGLDVIDQIEAPFDIVFNDIDKERYPMVPAKAAAVLRPGGLLISDNMLWFGRVIEPQATRASTRGVQELIRILHTSEEFHTTMLPLGDGVSLSVYSG